MEARWVVVSPPRHCFAQAPQGDVASALEALEGLSDLVSSAYGSDGAVIGHLVRSSGGVCAIAKRLRSVSPDVKQEALVLLGNLCYDAVDSGCARLIVLRCYLSSGGPCTPNIKTAAGSLDACFIAS